MKNSDDSTVHDLGTMPVEPEGPLHYLYAHPPDCGEESLRRLQIAWARVDAVTEPAPLATQLAQSLQLQTCTLIGECYNAIDRKCLLDLIPAWARLKVALELPVPLSDKAHACLRRDWFWGEARTYLTQALCYGEREYPKWHVLDMLIRGEAREAIAPAELSLTQYDTPECQDVCEMLRRNLKTYRDCAEGK